MAAHSRPDDNRPLHSIGKYQVERVLGRGAMGTVYRAHDPVIDRKVALKTMAPGVSGDPELRARFLREAVAAGRLRHRNIVTVYDLGEDRGQPYIAMEYVEGTDLETIIQRRQPLSVEWKLDVLRQVCEGLAHAHGHGIVHRDVKPANIRITPEGDVKIMDFGIAHLQSSTMTTSGAVLGTVHYMAPEQVESRKADHRADVFSVGAIAYELLTYRKPFEGDSLTQVMYRIVREDADLGALPLTEYSPGLEAIVARALAKAPEDRYASLDAMRDDLERVVQETAARLMERVSPGASPAPADVGSLKAAVAAARAAGHLQKAAILCRRVLEARPDDADARRLYSEVEAAIRDKEVEQLAAMALGYSAEGDTEFAMKIADRVGRLAPGSRRHEELLEYLREERARRDRESLLAEAQEHIVQGRIEEARRAAERILASQPDHELAREIRDRTARVLAVRSRTRRSASAPASPETRPPAAPSAEPAAEAARRRAEAASLTAAALERFLKNDHAGARASVERALALDPGNRRAQELLSVLGSVR